jgi:hypothetical protein
VIGLSAHADSDPIERVTWFYYQVKNDHHLPARGLAVKRQRYSVFFFLFSYTREVFCLDLLTLGFLNVSSYACFPRDPNMDFVAYSSYQLTWILKTFVSLILHLHLLQLMLAFAISMIMYRYLLLALNFQFCSFSCQPFIEFFANSGAEVLLLLAPGQGQQV